MGAIISIAVGLLAILAVVAVVGIALWVFLHVFGLILLESTARGVGASMDKLFKNPVMGCLALLVLFVLGGWLVWYGVESLWNQAAGLKISFPPLGVK